MKFIQLQSQMEIVIAIQLPRWRLRCWENLNLNFYSMWLDGAFYKFFIRIWLCNNNCKTWDDDALICHQIEYQWWFDFLRIAKLSCDILMKSQVSGIQSFTNEFIIKSIIFGNFTLQWSYGWKSIFFLHWWSNQIYGKKIWDAESVLRVWKENFWMFFSFHFHVSSFHLEWAVQHTRNNPRAMK